MDDSRLPPRPPWRREHDVEIDDTHALLTQAVWDRLDQYDSLGQPTSPSVGRQWKTRGGMYCEVLADPDDPQHYVLRAARIPLIV
jgi:hypothetical protein